MTKNDSGAEIHVLEEYPTHSKVQTQATIKYSGNQTYSDVKMSVPPLVYVMVASGIASIGGILFGYDIGIISGALLLLRKDFHLSNLEQEIVVCAVLLGAFCFSFLGGNIVDQFGRKQAIIISSILFISGALVLSFSENFAMLIVGRFVVGLAVSLSVTAECTYISELSPPNRRGMLVSLNEVGITFGFLLAFFLNYLFVSHEQGWRYMFGAAIIPSLIQIVGIAFMPESPHYLMVKGNTEEAKKVLKSLRGKNSVDEEMQDIKKNLEKKEVNNVNLWSSKNNIRERLFMGMMLVFLQQFSGNANVLYYAPIVFQQFGYCSDSSATSVTIGLGVVKVLSTTFTLLTVDNLGRRRMLLIGTAVMASSIIVLGVTAIVTIHHDVCESSNNINNSFSYEAPSNSDLFSKIYLLHGQNTTRASTDEFHLLEELNVWNNSGGNASKIESSGTDLQRKAAQYVSVISLMTFVCAYGISYGPVTWLVLSEIFPTALRGRAISTATCVNWGSNIIVSLTFLQMIDILGIGTTLILYGCISIAAFNFVMCFVPETRKKTLEQINDELYYRRLKRLPMRAT